MWDEGKEATATYIPNSENPYYYGYEENPNFVGYEKGEIAKDQKRNQNKAILKIIWKNKKQNNNGNTRQQRQTNHKCSQHKQNLSTARHRRKRNKHIHMYRSNTNSNITNLQPIQKNRDNINLT